MSDTAELSDPDFTAQMQGLIHQAEQALETRAGAVRATTEPARDAVREIDEKALKSYQSLPQMLRPLVIGLEAVGRATGENTQLLRKLETGAAGAGPGPAAPQELPQLLAELRTMVDQKNAVSRQMFDALHEELRSYKDGFLLDSVHRPLIRDLITLYDDMSGIHRQMQEVLELPGAGEPYYPLAERIRALETHLAHNLDFVLEVLARLEVTRMPEGEGKLDKWKQRAVAVEPTESAEEDLDVLKVLKRGFLWKDRVVRAEEVIVKKCKEGLLAPPPAST